MNLTSPPSNINTHFFSYSNRWLDAIEGLSAAYSDAGLLGIYGQADHDHSEMLFDLIRKQMATIPERITDPIVVMATNKCLSQKRMQFEERLASLEEVGRWASTADRMFCHEELQQGISEVTLPVIQDFVSKRVMGTPTVAVYGNLKGLESSHRLHSIV